MFDIQNNGRGVDTSTAILRANVLAVDEILGWTFPVLDHGFIRIIDYMGSDVSITQAARVSYASGTKQVSDDAGLINYLLRHDHTTPFEMCELKIHVKLPMFVARQWVRHRTASINEMSARYSILNKEFYIPETEHLAKQSTTNKQGRAEQYSLEDAISIQHYITDSCETAYSDYEFLHNDGLYKDESGFSIEGYGLTRELSRMVLPVNIYTEWYWKVNAHNLMHFLRLRADPHAQYEIRAYADVLVKLLARWLPITAQAFQDYKLNTMTFTLKEQAMLASMMEGIPYNTEALRMSAGEVKEYDAKIIKLKGQL